MKYLYLLMNYVVYINAASINLIFCMSILSFGITYIYLLCLYSTTNTILYIQNINQSNKSDVLSYLIHIWFIFTRIHIQNIFNLYLTSADYSYKYSLMLCLPHIDFMLMFKTICESYNSWLRNVWIWINTRSCNM